MDIDVLKGQAKRLASYLEHHHDVNLKLGQAQDAVAFMNEKRDWNTLVASASRCSKAAAATAAANPAGNSSGPRSPGHFMFTVQQTADDWRMTEPGAHFLSVVKDAYSGNFSDIGLVQTGVTTAEIQFHGRGETVGRDITVEKLRELSKYAFSIADKGKIPRIPGMPTGVGLRFDEVKKQPGGFDVIRLKFVGITAFERLPATLNDLGFPPDQVEQLKAATASLCGLFIVAGRGGSGRSTTAHRITEAMTVGTNRKALLVGSDTSMLFSDAVRIDMASSGTADLDAQRRLNLFGADVVVFDEITDDRTIRSAVQLAMTGVQVWAVMRANSPEQAIDQVLRQVPDSWRREDGRHMIGAVIWQELLPCLCHSCKVRATEKLEKDELERLSIRFGGIDADSMFVRSEHGCDHCDHAGSTRKMVVAEIVTPNIRWNHTTALQRAARFVAQGLADPRQADRSMVGYQAGS